MLQNLAELPTRFQKRLQFYWKRSNCTFLGCASKRTVVGLPDRVRMHQKLFIAGMATKENKRQVRELVEGLEQRVHRGPVIRDVEIQSARNFLLQHDISPASDYFDRLARVEDRLQGRAREVFPARTKRNYGGEAGGRQMQVQFIYDHLILSTCYAGEFNTRRGRIKISHRFNQEGRMDFVELKFLRSLDPLLNGELRTLLTVKDYPTIQKDWYEAKAYVLRVLPRELVFLYEDFFRCPRAQALAWLLNIGHGMAEDLLNDLKARESERSFSSDSVSSPACPDFGCAIVQAPNLSWPPETRDPNGRGRTVCLDLPRVDRDGYNYAERSEPTAGHPGQLPLDALLPDEAAMSVLEKAARLESVVEIESLTEVLVRYQRKPQ